MNYRKIWEKHNGPIPLDKHGRKFDIHHIDKNRDNNSIDNLLAVSIQDHYNIHYSQQDWNACILIRRRLKLSKEQVEEINKCYAESKKGVACLEETKKKISKTLTGRKRGPLSEEWKTKISQANKGKTRNNGRTGIKHSEETKRKIGEANSRALKGRKLSEEHRLKYVGRVPPNKGISSSDETRKKISDSKKGRPWTEARRLAQKQRKI